MPFNLLLIPLMGGYIFVRFWHYSKISILRADKDRLLIRASIAGFFSLGLAFALSIFVESLWPCPSQGYCLYSWWKEHVPFEYMGVSVLSFLISCVGCLVLNFFSSDEKAVDRAIEEDADPLEVTLKVSADLEQPLCITLNDGKVYVGIVTHQFNPATPTNNIAIFPLQSGYREKDTRELRLTINYAVIVKEMRDKLDAIADEVNKQWEQAESSVDPDQAERCSLRAIELGAEWDDLEHRIDLFEVIIPVSAIASIFYFDEVTYDEHFRVSRKKTRRKPPSGPEQNA
jgi:hypothetical protein